ncbi:MAG: DUF4988 domain-containing protein [Bacteroidales bacterium]|nr:DUF4988 domain-containing protein [Bacteroidales bacterium]
MRLNYTLRIAAAVVTGILSLSCSEKFDPSYLEQKIENLENRVSKLEEAASSVNSSIVSLQSIVNALRNNIYVSSVEKTEEGTVITFSDGTVSVISASAGNANVPVVGVAEVDGIYYWTLGGEFILDKDGNKLPVSGKDGQNGEDGKDGQNGTDGTTPVIGIQKVGDAYYWTVNGEFILDAAGNKIPAYYENQGTGSNPGSGSASDSIFSSVVVKDGVVTFTLADGTSFIIPMKPAANLRIEAGKLYFNAGESKTVHIATENIVGSTITEVPFGWRASINGCVLTIQAPKTSSVDADEAGYVAVLATSGDQTFIGKIRVTMDEPLFAMGVNPTGVLTIEELDSDLNMPGFLAGFVKAEEFDAATVIEPAKGANTSNYEDIYMSWSSNQQGKSIDVLMSESGITPVAGQRYAAYCYPGYYSRMIGVEPNPYDVSVVYFTYVNASFSLSGVSTDKATVSANVYGADSFYGGIVRYFDDMDMDALKESFLEDAEAPFKGYGDGMTGVMMTSYSGALNMFAALDDGEGKKNARTIVPGATYAIGILAKDSERVYEEYSPSEVIIKMVELQKPTETTMALATVEAGASTTVSASAVFSITSQVSKFFYTLVPTDKLKESKLSAYDYVTRYGVIWDRSVIKATGAISGIDMVETGLKPGQECTAIGAAFTSAGQYQLVTMTVNADEVVLSNGTLTIDSHTLTPISANSVEVDINYTASSEISKVRYMNMTASEYTAEYGSEDAVFSTLTAGSRWDYNEINAGEDIEMYVYPESVDYIFFAIGVDGEGKFTALAQHTYQPVE